MTEKTLYRGKIAFFTVIILSFVGMIVSAGMTMFDHLFSIAYKIFVISTLLGVGGGGLILLIGMALLAFEL